MSLTKEFKETVKGRAMRDPAFRAALLAEVRAQLLAGDPAVGQAILTEFTDAVER
jgi:hypothetical protein